MAAMPKKLKVLLVGPSQVGKSTIANFLSEHTETLTAKSEYQPTAALRVLEFERELSEDSYSRGTNVPVELWDVAGDHKYEACWPAIIKGAHGVILVYNPDNRAHEKEIEIWYEFFVKMTDVDEANCLVLAHRPSPGSKTRPPKAISNVVMQNTSFESPGLLRMEVDKYLAGVAADQLGR